MKSLCRAVCVIADEDADTVTASRCAFRWSDVYAVQDDMSRRFDWPRELTWITTEADAFFIDSPFDVVLAEWEAYLSEPSPFLAFTSRN